jgi:hypothetical protein
MDDSRNPLSGEDEVNSGFAAKSLITVPRTLELSLIDGTAEFRHESLH